MMRILLTHRLKGKEELRCECSAMKTWDLALEVYLLKCMDFPGEVVISSEAGSQKDRNPFYGIWESILWHFCRGFGYPSSIYRTMKILHSPEGKMWALIHLSVNY